MNVVVTGAGGFVGWHVSAALASEGHVVRRVTREGFAERLADALDGADALVHIAGVNRGTDAEVQAGNAFLAEAVGAAIAKHSVATVINMNSTQSLLGNVYGQAKLAASATIEAACAAAGARFVDIIAPNLFGERGRPDYNSFATFAFNVANGRPPASVNDREIALLHVQDLADVVIELLDSSKSGAVEVLGHPTSVKKVLDDLESFHASYGAGVLPDTRDAHQLALFNTYRSYLYPQGYPIPFKKNTDNRGHLVETVKTRDKGQAFVSTTKPGITRGNHWHRRKIERFLVLEGTADIQIRRLFDDEIRTFRVDGENPCAIDIPTLHTHNITNVGDSTLLTFFWSNDIFDPENPDTFALPIARVGDEP